VTGTLRAWTAVLGVVVVAGCATPRPALTPDQQQGLAWAIDFADATSRLYGMGRIPVVAGQTPGFGALWRNGTVQVVPRALTEDWRDALLAHELGHAVLGHGTGASPGSFDDAPRGRGDRRWMVPEELDANAKAVEILTRVRSWSERRSLRAVYWWLLGQHREEQAGRPVPPGHLPACAEIRDLLERFPEHVAVTRYWGCL
jgi:hypothetical protein